MFFLKNKSAHDLPHVNVEISIIALLKDRYINEVFTISVPQDATIKQLLKTARAQDLINKDIFNFVKKLNPPISLIVNGTNISGRQSSKHKISDGDQITIFTPLSGG